MTINATLSLPTSGGQKSVGVGPKLVEVRPSSVELDLISADSGPNMAGFVAAQTTVDLGPTLANNGQLRSKLARLRPAAVEFGPESVKHGRFRDNLAGARNNLVERGTISAEIGPNLFDVA